MTEQLVEEKTNNKKKSTFKWGQILQMKRSTWPWPCYQTCELMRFCYSIQTNRNKPFILHCNWIIAHPLPVTKPSVRKVSERGYHHPRRRWLITTSSLKQSPVDLPCRWMQLLLQVPQVQPKLQDSQLSVRDAGCVLPEWRPESHCITCALRQMAENWRIYLTTLASIYYLFTTF